MNLKLHVQIESRATLSILQDLHAKVPLLRLHATLVSGRNMQSLQDAAI